MGREPSRAIPDEDVVAEATEAFPTTTAAPAPPTQLGSPTVQDTDPEDIEIRKRRPATTKERERRLLDAIAARPGSHLRQLHRSTGIPLGTTARTLARLEEGETILAEEIDAYRRYFPKEGIHRRERIVLAHVAAEKSRSILRHVLDEPGIGHKALHQKVGIPGPTLSYYLARLERDQVIVARERKNRRFFRIKNPDLVSRALERWHVH